MIGNARPGLFNVEARRIGYGIGRADDLRRVADSVAVQDCRLDDNPLRLESVVVSGGVEETQGVMTPYTVAQLTAAELPVPPNMSAAGLIQGEVAGVQVLRGRGPDAGVNVQIRRPRARSRRTARSTSWTASCSTRRAPTSRATSSRSTSRRSR